MRTFVMVRDIDDTGISGTGIVAEGVEFGDGRVVLRWFGEHSSIVHWADVSHVLAIHGHNGKTRIEWADA
jgi:hypothetical protein